MPNRPDSAKGCESNIKQVSAIHLWSLTLPEGIQTLFSSKHDLNESTYENDQWKIVCRPMGRAHDCQLKWHFASWSGSDWHFASSTGSEWHFASWSGKQLLAKCHGLFMPATWALIILPSEVANNYWEFAMGLTVNRNQNGYSVLLLALHDSSTNF